MLPNVQVLALQYIEKAMFLYITWTDIAWDTRESPIDHCALTCCTSCLALHNVSTSGFGSWENEKFVVESFTGEELFKPNPQGVEYFAQEAYIEQAVRTGVRVTLQMGESARHVKSQGWEGHGKMYSARLANMADPRQKLGLYWGYQTRIAHTLQQLTIGCPFKVTFYPPPIRDCRRLAKRDAILLLAFIDWGQTLCTVEIVWVKRQDCLHVGGCGILIQGGASLPK